MEHNKSFQLLIVEEKEKKSPAQAELRLNQRRQLRRLAYGQVFGNTTQGRQRIKTNASVTIARRRSLVQPNQGRLTCRNILPPANITKLGKREWFVLSLRSMKMVI